MRLHGPPLGIKRSRFEAAAGTNVVVVADVSAAAVAGTPVAAIARVASTARIHVAADTRVAAVSAAAAAVAVVAVTPVGQLRWERGRQAQQYDTRHHATTVVVHVS